MNARELIDVIDAAEGRLKADTVFRNAQIVDVYGHRVAKGSVAVRRGVIAGVMYEGRDDVEAYDADEVVDCEGRYLAPGLIDGHLHIESSNIRPAEYARVWRRRAAPRPPLPTATRSRTSAGSTASRS